MAQLHTREASDHVELVRAMVPHYMNTAEGIGDDLWINNADSGIEFATSNRSRVAVVVGDTVSRDYVRINWKEMCPDGGSSWSEDITTHSVTSLFGVVEKLVRFVCDAEWPGFCTRHKKWPNRVTDLKDDKPYGTVDLVIQISSSLESLDLYRMFKEQKLEYIQDMGGYLHTIGHINDRPICISPMIHKIGGVNVMYVEASSGLVDWEMIEEWVKDRVPKDTPMCNDPINALNYIWTARRKKEETTNKDL